MVIGIVGLGLIGGSAAKALKARTGHTVLGRDTDAAVIEAALVDGAIDAELAEAEIGECDALLLALYPGVAVKFARENAGRIAKGALVVDLCGVKREVAMGIAPIAEEHGFSYIGGHPMAGTERSGYSSAFANLFAGASMILTPDARTAPDAVRRARALFLEMGFGCITPASPDEHDRIIAYTSQLAHVLSSAYVKSPAAVEYRGFSAGSFRDMTRVAWLNESMWTELFLDNADYLADEVEGLAERLAQYAAAIRAGDAKTLCSLLREGRERKELLGRE